MSAGRHRQTLKMEEATHQGDERRTIVWCFLALCLFSQLSEAQSAQQCGESKESSGEGGVGSGLLSSLSSFFGRGGSSSSSSSSSSFGAAAGAPSLAASSLPSFPDLPDDDCMDAEEQQEVKQVKKGKRAKGAKAMKGLHALMTHLLHLLDHFRCLSLLPASGWLLPLRPFPFLFLCSFIWQVSLVFLLSFLFSPLSCSLKYSSSFCWVFIIIIIPFLFPFILLFLCCCRLCLALQCHCCEYTDERISYQWRSSCPRAWFGRNSGLLLSSLCPVCLLLVLCIIHPSFPPSLSSATAVNTPMSEFHISEGLAVLTLDLEGTWLVVVCSLLLFFWLVLVPCVVWIHSFIHPSLHTLPGQTVSRWSLLFSLLLSLAHGQRLVALLFSFSCSSCCFCHPLRLLLILNYRITIIEDISKRTWKRFASSACILLLLLIIILHSFCVHCCFIHHRSSSSCFLYLSHFLDPVVSSSLHPDWLICLYVLPHLPCFLPPLFACLLDFLLLPPLPLLGSFLLFFFRRSTPSCRISGH